MDVVTFFNDVVADQRIIIGLLALLLIVNCLNLLKDLVQGKTDAVVQKSKRQYLDEN